MSQLKSFLLSLSEDTQLLHDWKRDPASAMERAGLTEREREILLSGDPTQIKNEIGPDRPDVIIVISYH